MPKNHYHNNSIGDIHRQALIPPSDYPNENGSTKTQKKVKKKFCNKKCIFSHLFFLICYAFSFILILYFFAPFINFLRNKLVNSTSTQETCIKSHIRQKNFTLNRLRIAQIAPLHEAVPPKMYGGTERAVSYLTEALVEMGHDVTLFASGDSKTSARLVPIWSEALRLDKNITDRVAPQMFMIEKIFQQAENFDILHFHIDYYPFSMFSRQNVPFLTTLHGSLSKPELKLIYTNFEDIPVVSISDSQRMPIPSLQWISTIYHGLPKNLLNPRPNANLEYLAFLGRVSPEKGLDTAIRIAGKSGRKIKIAAKIDFTFKNDQKYYEEKIKPLFNLPYVEYVGEINETQKADFLGNAEALIFPIAWDEPFGLVMIEAMACGTPVVAFKKGSVPEVIVNGVSGFIVKNEKEAVAAVNKLGTLSRGKVRATFEERFLAKIMAKNYLKVYEKLLVNTSLRATRTIF